MALGDEPRELADNHGIPPALGFDYPSQQLYLGIRVLIRFLGLGIASIISIIFSCAQYTGIASARAL